MSKRKPEPAFPAPPKDANAEFDQMADKVWAALVFVGNPDHLTEGVVRDRLAHAFGVKAGVKFETDR